MRSRWRQRLLRLLCAMGAALAVVRPAAAQTLSLDDAVSMAMTSNRTLLSKALEIDKAEQQIADARSRRYPTFEVETQAAQLLTPVSVLFPAGSFGTYDATGPLPSVDTELTTPRRVSVYLSAQASQPLSQLVKLGLSIKLSSAGAELARTALRATRLTVAHEVRRRYFALLQSQSQLDAAEFSVTLLERLDREVSTRVTQRVALKSEGLTVSARLAEAQLTRVRLRNAVATQKEELNHVLGRDIRTSFDVNPIAVLPELTRDRDAAQAEASESRPDIRQARLRVEQADLAHRIARADRLPDIGVAFSYLSPFNIDGAPSNLATVALQFRWEPFDWGRKNRAVAARAIDRQQAEHSLSDTEQQAAAEVSAGLRRLDEAAATLRVVQLAQESARETARVRTTQFASQAALLSDVLQSEASVAEADDRYRQALLSVWTARAGLDYAIGRE